MLELWRGRPELASFFVMLALIVPARAGDCHIESGRGSGAPVPSSMAVANRVSALKDTICDSDLAVIGESIIPIWDGSVEIKLQIRNAGVADGLLEVADKAGRVVKRYLVPGMRPLPGRLQRLLQFDASTAPVFGNSVSDPALSTSRSRQTVATFKLPVQGSFRLHKTGDRVLAANLARIALEQASTRDPELSLQLADFWRIVDTVGIHAAAMLRERVLHNALIDLEAGLKVSLSVIKGMIIALSRHDQSLVTSMLSGGFQGGSERLRWVLVSLEWTGEQSARFDFGETLVDLRQTSSGLRFDNDYQRKQSVTKIPIELTGSWSGQVDVLPHRIHSSQPVNFDLRSNVRFEIDPARNLFFVRYLDLGCLGFLVPDPERMEKGNHVFREILVVRGKACRHDGRISFLEPYADRALFIWEHPETGEKAMAGTLSKQSQLPQISQDLVEQSKRAEEAYALLGSIDNLLQASAEPPEYLYRTDTFKNSTATVFTDLTDGILGTGDLRVSYEDLYNTAVEYAAMNKLSLNRAQRAALQLKVALAQRHIDDSARYLKQSELASQGATQAYLGQLESAEIFARGIYEGSKAAAIYGSKMLGPGASKSVDLLFEVLDYSIDASASGHETAIRNLLKRQLVEFVFSELPLAELGGKSLEETIGKHVTHAMGSSQLYALLKSIFDDPNTAKAFMGFIAKSSAHAAQRFSEQQIEVLLDTGIDYIEGQLPPLTNCGSEKYQRYALQFLEVEQAVRAGYSFDSVCLVHDDCYGNCSKTKATCDQDLKQQALTICESVMFNPRCVADAELFYQAVDHFGDSAFDAAQAQCARP